MHMRRRMQIAALLLTMTAVSSCKNTTDDSSSGSYEPDLSAPDVDLYSAYTGEVYFMMPIDATPVGYTPVEYWIYYNTNGSDAKNYYGILPENSTLKNLKSGITIYFFVRKYYEGTFGPFSPKKSIKVK